MKATEKDTPFGRLTDSWPQLMAKPLATYVHNIAV